MLRYQDSAIFAKARCTKVSVLDVHHLPLGGEIPNVQVAAADREELTVRSRASHHFIQEKTSIQARSEDFE